MRPPSLQISSAMVRAIVAVLIALMASAAAADSSVGPTPRKVDARGIENFSEILGDGGFGGPLVGFGGATLPDAMPWLKHQGFVTVVNLRLAGEAKADVEASRAAAEAAGMKYVHIPFDPGSADVATTVAAFLAAVSAKANQPVYVHCNSATRVAALWMIGRVVEDHWSVDAAANEAESIARKPDQAIAIATRYLEPRQ